MLILLSAIDDKKGPIFKRRDLYLSSVCLGKRSSHARVTHLFNLHPDFSRVPPSPDFSRVLSEKFLGQILPSFFSGWQPKLHIPSTLNIDLQLWHTHWLCEQKMLNHSINHWFFLSLFKLISCPIHTLNFMCVSLLKFYIWILEQF